MDYITIRCTMNQLFSYTFCTKYKSCIRYMNDNKLCWTLMSDNHNTNSPFPNHYFKKNVKRAKA